MVFSDSLATLVDYFHKNLVLLALKSSFIGLASVEIIGEKVLVKSKLLEIFHTLYRKMGSSLLSVQRNSIIPFGIEVFIVMLFSLISNENVADKVRVPEKFETFSANSIDSHNS